MNISKRNLVVVISFIVSSVLLLAQDSRSLEKRSVVSSEEIVFGKQYLLIIGIASYEQFPRLLIPVVDAREVRKILSSRYYFDEIIELYDQQATKRNIIEVFGQLQKLLQPEDSLLIYYAGHGYFDSITNSSFLIPVNGGSDIYEQQNWLPHSQISGFISGIRARHLCLISDSCFAGDILDFNRGLNANLEDVPALKKAYRFTSRQVITSGSRESVPDDSEFTRQLKSALLMNQHPYLDAFMLFNEIRLGVTHTTPLLGYLKNTGHQPGAAFILFLKQHAGALQTGPGEGDASAYPTGDSPADRGDYLVVSSGGGLNLPLGSSADILQWSLSPVLGAYYLFALRHIDLGFGLKTFFRYEKTEPEYVPDYAITSLAFFAALRLQTGGSSRLYGSAEISTGGVLNSQEYYNPQNPAALGLRFGCGLAAGGGVNLTPRLSLAFCTEWHWVFYNDLVYTACSPLLALELKY